MYVDVIFLFNHLNKTGQTCYPQYNFPSFLSQYDIYILYIICFIFSYHKPGTR